VITSVIASLSIVTDHPRRQVGHLTTLLGIAPTTVWEYGDPWPSKTRSDRLRSHGQWRFEEPRTIASEEDPHGMESLVRLAERFEPVAEALGNLGPDYKVLVRMMGHSDSAQGGFYIGPETMRRLGLLHAAFLPDIFLHDELHESDLGANTDGLAPRRERR
jgi:hypothetical protein